MTNSAKAKTLSQEQKCLLAICEAWWANTPTDSSCIEEIRDTIVLSELSEDPTPEQIKALFMQFPASIIGSGISWGFDDTVVREEIYEYVERNKEAISKSIFQ